MGGEEDDNNKIVNHYCNNQSYPSLVKGQVSARFDSKLRALFLRVLEGLRVMKCIQMLVDDNIVS